MIIRFYAHFLFRRYAHGNNVCTRCSRERDLFPYGGRREFVVLYACIIQECRFRNIAKLQTEQKGQRLSENKPDSLSAFEGNRERERGFPSTRKIVKIFEQYERETKGFI